MKIKRLLVPGRFQDVYLYRDWFIGLTDYRTLKFIGLSTRSEEELRFFKEANPRNDESKRARPGPDDRAFESSFGTLTHSVSRTIIPATEEVDLVMDANIVLDLAVYKEHLYLGTDKGLFSARLELGRTRGRFHEGLQRQHDARALKVSARFDRVTISCGEEGLFAGVRVSDKNHGALRLQKVEKQSLKNAWLQSSLVNYPSHREWDILSTAALLEPGDNERLRMNRLFEDQQFGFGSLLEEIRRHQSNFDKDDVQFAFNSDRYIFVHSFDGSFFSLRLGKMRGMPHVYFHRTYKGRDVRILSAAPLGDGVVIETQDRVFLFALEEWTLLLDREALSVRTFPNSSKFRNIASIAAEDGLHLISVLPNKRLRMW